MLQFASAACSGSILTRLSVEVVATQTNEFGYRAAGEALKLSGLQPQKAVVLSFERLQATGPEPTRSLSLGDFQNGWPAFFEVLAIFTAAPFAASWCQVRGRL